MSTVDELFAPKFLQGGPLTDAVQIEMAKATRRRFAPLPSGRSHCAGGRFPERPDLPGLHYRAVPDPVRSGPVSNRAEQPASLRWSRRHSSHLRAPLRTGRCVGTRLKRASSGQSHRRIAAVNAPLPPLGCTKDELETPALCLDLDIFEANVRHMAGACQRHGVAWRPHAKCHKSPAIAQRLLAAGAIGMTCAKLGEAEVFAAAGIRDLLIANMIVGPNKLRRLAALRRIADPIVCVDHERSRDRAEPGDVYQTRASASLGRSRPGIGSCWCSPWQASFRARPANRR